MPKVIYFAINRFTNLELSRSALQIPAFLELNSCNDCTGICRGFGS